MKVRWIGVYFPFLISNYVLKEASKKMTRADQQNEFMRITRNHAKMQESYDSSRGPSPFDSLPDEMLVAILKYLDAESLKNATLVNRKWSVIIGQSLKLMTKFQLKILSCEKGKFRKVVRCFQRRYRCVTSYRLHSLNTRIEYKRLIKLYYQLNEAHFLFCDFSESNCWDFLLACKNVRNLSLIGNLNIEAHHPFSPTDFPKLELLCLTYNPHVGKI
jgi:hypothetical protein